MNREQTWRIDVERRSFKRRVAIEAVKAMNEVELDALLRAVGIDPDELRSPLPNPTLLKELDGIA